MPLNQENRSQKLEWNSRAFEKTNSLADGSRSRRDRCPFRDITVRRIIDIREFKLYDQPNLELGWDKDFSVCVGSIRNIRFDDLTFHRPGKVELHANTDGLTIRNIHLHHPVAVDCHLPAIGPNFQAYKHGGETTDPARWVEVFSPDLDCTVRNVSVTGVPTRGSQADLLIEQVVKVTEMKSNPVYPRTTPKDGKGKGTWID